jgi:hypothetical protein
VQQLLVWGGRDADDTVRAMAGLDVDRDRLHEVGRTWHGAADLVGSVASALERDGAATADWGGEAATVFHAVYRDQVRRCSALAESYRRVGDAVMAAAESLGQAHEALVAVTVAAGQSLAALAPAAESPQPEGPARVVVESWRAVSAQLVRHSAELAASTAATLGALAPPAPGPTARHDPA